MARFIFKLETVLSARKAAERERQRAAAILERQRLELEERLRGQQALIAEGRGALRSGLVGRIDTLDLRRHAASTTRMMRDAQAMAIELAQVYERMERARADLAEAAAARRAMELLRDRRFAQWRLEQEKREAAAMDDLAGSKAARRRRNEEIHS